MNPANFRVRRATLDDLSQMTELWKSMRLPTEELSKRITEFQVAESADGKIVGAVGLQIAEKQGRIHGEAFSDFALADLLRPMLWDRVLSVAKNHGLLRLWTQEHAPFWSHSGLNRPDAEILAKLPALWRSSQGNWLMLKLKDEVDAIISADKEFAAFMEAQRLETAKALQHAKVLKFIATLVALAVLGLVFVGGFFLIKHNPRLLGR